MARPSSEDIDRARATADVVIDTVTTPISSIGGPLVIIRHGEKFKEFLVLALLLNAGFEVESQDGK